MFNPSVCHILNVSLFCALMAFSANAAEEPPSPDNSGDNDPVPVEGEECESDEDCPDGYICSMGMLVDSEDAHEQWNDSDETDEPEEDTGAGPGADDEDGSGDSTGGSGASTGVCIPDPSCDSNDDCLEGEFCSVTMYLDCTENADGTQTCSSAQDGWCSFDYRDDCTASDQCSFPEICYQRPIDDHAHCTDGYDVPCSADVDCGDRLICQATLVDQMCFWNESGALDCETLTADRCAPRACTNSDVCLDDEICMIMPHRNPPNTGPIVVETINEGEEQDSQEDVENENNGDDAAEPGHGMPEEEGLCAPYEEAHECENDEDCGTHEECATMTNLPCFEGDMRCEEASINVCAHERIECEENVDCPSEYHCSFHYAIRDPFDPYGGVSPIDAGEVEPSVDGDEEPNDDNEGEDENDSFNDEGHGGGEVHPPGEDNGQGPPPMDIGLCFPEFEDMLICDENGCMVYVDHSWFSDGGDGTISEPVEEEDDEGTVDNGTGNDGNDNSDGAGDTNNDTAQGDQNMETTVDDGAQPLFNCQTSGSDGCFLLLGLLIFLRLRRRD